MKTNWKLTIHEASVVVVKESDLPSPFDPDKALKVTNIIGTFGCADGNPALLYGIGKNVENGFFTIRMGENQLYDIPEGWEVQIDKYNRCNICGATAGQSCAEKSGEAQMLDLCNCDMYTAAIVRSTPVEVAAVKYTDYQKRKAIHAKAEWLAYCKSIGWTDIDGLDKIWDKFKDEGGNLRAPAVENHEDQEAMWEDVMSYLSDPEEIYYLKSKYTLTQKP